MVHKVNDVKQIVYLPKVLLKISMKDIIIKEKKVKDQIRKIASQKKHPRNIRIINHLISLKELSRLQKLYFPFFARLFSQFLFFLGQGESTPGKNPQKLNENSGEIPVHTDVGKIMQNVGSRRLTPKWAKLICYPILKIQSY